MGKVKPAPQGAGKKDSQTSPSLRRSSRGTIAIEDNTIAGTPDADPLPGPSNLERRRIAATLPGSTTASGIKRPPPTGRKLSALSAHKRRLPTDATPGSIASAGRRQFSSPPQKEATKTPSQEPQMEGAKSPPIKGAPPMTVAEVNFFIKRTALSGCLRLFLFFSSCLLFKLFDSKVAFHCIFLYRLKN